MQKHWSDQYANASTATLEGKIRVAACHTGYHIGQEAEHEEKSRAIGQIAFDQNTNIFHASWLYHGSKGRCGCSPCEKARRK